MNVRLAADNAGTVRKKFGKTSFCDSSPEAADGETCEKKKKKEKKKTMKSKIKSFLFCVKTFHDLQPKEPRVLSGL